jgi:hypothetical protein
VLSLTWLLGAIELYKCFREVLNGLVILSDSINVPSFFLDSLRHPLACYKWRIV